MDPANEIHDELAQELRRLLGKYTEGDHFLPQGARQWIIGQALEPMDAEERPDIKAVNQFIDRFCREHGIGFKHKGGRSPAGKRIGIAVGALIVAAAGLWALSASTSVLDPALERLRGADPETASHAPAAASMDSQAEAEPCAASEILSPSLVKRHLEAECAGLSDPDWKKLERAYAQIRAYIDAGHIKHGIGAESAIKALGEIAPGEHPVIKAAASELTTLCREVDACCLWSPTAAQRQAALDAYHAAQQALVRDHLTDPFQGSAEQMRQRIIEVDPCAPEAGKLAAQIARQYLFLSIRHCGSRPQSARNFCGRALEYDSSPAFLREVRSISCCADMSP